MSSTDQALYFAMRAIDVAARDDHAAYVELHAEIDASDLDPTHVLMTLAVMQAETIKRDPHWRRHLDETLEQTRLIAAADIPSPEPEHLDHKPRRSRWRGDR